MPKSRSTAPAEAKAPAGAMEAMRPPRISRSMSTRPSLSTGPGGVASSSARATRAWRRRKSPEGTLTKPISVLAPDGALVPFAQAEMRNEGQAQEDDDAGQRNQQESGEHPRYLQLKAGFQPGGGKAGRHASEP